MVAKIVYDFILTLGATLKQAQQTSHGFVPAALTASTLWAAWWLWKFTLSPAIYPDAPRQLPYWIPFVGHARAMMMNADKLFSYGREYFGNTREVFTITVAGEEMYIVTSPEDVLSVYKNTKALDFNPIIRDIMTDFGLTPTTLDKMFEQRFTGKCWMDLTHDDFKLQLHPGEKLDALQDTFLGNIDRSMSWDKLDGPMVLAGSGTDEKVVSLFKWCGEVLVDSATRAFFGDALYQVAPDLLKDFFTFDNESWKLNYKYPHFAAKDMYAAKANGEAAFVKYLALPKEQRQDASWIVQAIEQGMKDISIDEESQRAPMLFVFYRLINTNAYKLAFWLLAHLLHNPTLLSAIQSEIAPAFTTTGSLNLPHLLTHSPLLTALYAETLRLANAPIGPRLVVARARLGPRLLQPGRRLLMPYRQLHLDAGVFGANPAAFDPARF
ncbi:cytochrome P450, partial [Glonium stellatum]